jgi:hypothetical protein
MSREIHSSSYEFDEDMVVLAVSCGGTGGMTSREAATHLGGISKDDYGTPSGPVPLVGGFVPDRYLNISGTSHPSLNGTSMDVGCGYTLTFQITNYDFNTKYTITTTAGSAVRVGDTITYTAPTYATTDHLVINGRSYTIVVHTASVDKPTITSPISGTTGRSSSVTFQASAFSVSYGADTHSASTWHIATDAAFSSTFVYDGDDAVNKTSYTVTGLAENTTYYARVEYKGATSGYGAWSDGISFTTRLTYGPYLNTGSLAGSDVSTVTDLSVAVSTGGTYAFIGTSSVSSNTGAVYVFKQTSGTWSQVAKLTASDASSNAFFGCKIAIANDGSYLAVGAYGNASYKGAVYIFLKGTGDTWTQQAKLAGSDAVAPAWCGYDVALDNTATTLVMGARALDSRKGAAYVFKRSGTTWSQLQKLRPSGALINDCFSACVAISGDGNLIVCSAPQDGNGVAASALYGYFTSYYYSTSTYAQSAIFYANSAGIPTGQRFGESRCVALSKDGSMLAVGAPLTSPGKLSILTRNTSALSNTFSLYSTITDPDSATTFFGYSPTWAADSSYLVFSNLYYNSQTGRAYLYRWKNNTLTLQVRLDPPTATTGQKFGSSCSMSPDGAISLIAAAGLSNPVSPTYVFD